jgi:ATP-dependent DNA helicase RecG
VNEFRRWPLLRVHEWLMQAIGVRNEEQELMVGGVRIGVPRYDRAGVREAINNALIHRDYTSLGAVHVQLRDDHVRVSNPGGFVAGVGPDNLLVIEPRPRNPRLADAFKRVGLVERTGRGVETIYRGQLRNGRRPPDYTLSTAVSVSVLLPSGPADLDFVLLTVQASRRLDRALETNELLALWQARREGATTAQTLAPALQRDAAYAADVLAGLAQAEALQVSAGLYRLSPAVYREAEVEPPSASPQELILAYVQTHGQITRRAAMALTGLGEEQARYHLRKLTRQGALELVGARRGAYYRLPGTEKNGE